MNTFEMQAAVEVFGVVVCSCVIEAQADLYERRTCHHALYLSRDLFLNLMIVVVSLAMVCVVGLSVARVVAVAGLVIVLMEGEAV